MTGIRIHWLQSRALSSRIRANKDCLIGKLMSSRPIGTAAWISDMDQSERHRLGSLGKEALNAALAARYDDARPIWTEMTKSSESFYKNDGLTNLAELYIKGRGGPCDFRAGLKLLQQVVPNEVNEIIKSDKDYYLGKAAYMMALIFEKGGPGVHQDVTRAFELLKQGASYGDANAAHRLGCYYRNGVCTAPSFRLAAKYFKIAAREDHEEAVRDLQELRENGRLGILWRLAGRTKPTSSG